MTHIPHNQGLLLIICSVKGSLNHAEPYTGLFLHKRRHRPEFLIFSCFSNPHVILRGDFHIRALIFCSEWVCIDKRHVKEVRNGSLANGLYRSLPPKGGAVKS